MTTEERLARLEAELTVARRRMRWIVAVVFLTATGLLTSGFVTKTPETVFAKSFTVVDENGKIAAVFGIGKEGPLLTMNDRSGARRLLLVATDDGSMVGLCDKTGKARAGLSMLKDGARLELIGDKGVSRALLVADKQLPRLELRDEDGKTFMSTQ